MIRTRLLFIWLLATCRVLVSGQENQVLLTIGDEKVTLEDFERIYRKNNNESSLNKQSPEEYLDLFINFKLKVKEAESLGMDTTSKFINELEGYREQLAKPYLTDEETKQEMIREAYERSKQDVHVSHILIKLPPNPTPEDTLAAYEKISEIRQRIVNGESFETVARATSDDSSVGRNGGDLNYFTVFSMIYPFETVAYNTPVGEISMPFRSTYGYHILKVHDKRPARGQVKVAHIFVRTPEMMSEAQKEESYEKAQMVYDSLMMGADFAEMAMKYSEDPNSARGGGEIPWFGTGRMIKEFEDACFSLEKPGDICKPFKSYYGWHIIKLLDKKEVGTFEEELPALQEKINRGERGKYRAERYIDKLKSEYGYELDPVALKKVYSAVDSSLLRGEWKTGNLRNDGSTLMRIGDRKVPVSEFAAYMESNQEQGKSRDPESYAEQMVDQFTNDLVMKYEESRLPEKYPEFRNIYHEYHDGILLFDIMDQKVWSKAVSDTVGLEQFHRSHKQDYMWGEREEAMLITCTEGTDISGVRKAYKKIMKGRLDQSKLNDMFCSSDSTDCITVTRLLVENGENEMVDALKGVPGLGPVTEEEGVKKFVILKGIRPPEPKELYEARGQITSDYQDYLEDKWISELKEKYPVKVNRELLQRIKT